MGIMITRANEKLANKIGVLMLQVYNDAKIKAVTSCSTHKTNQQEADG